VRNSCTHQGGETKIKLWGVALLGCALNCKTRVGGHAVGSFSGRGPRVWGPAKGLRPAGQCYPACHAVASSRLFCVLDAAILCLLSPCPSVSISLSVCIYLPLCLFLSLSLSLSGIHVLPCPVIFRLFGFFGVPLSAHL